MSQPFRLTEHAKSRRSQMRVSIDEVMDALNTPDWDYPQGYTYSGRRVAAKGRVAVVYAINKGVRDVVTIVWNTHDVFTRKD